MANQYTWNSGSAWNSGQKWGVSEPVDPENLTATTESEGEISLEWDPVGAVDQTNIYRAEESGDTLTDYEQVATVDAPAESYTDADLTNGRTYYYRVATENAVDESGASNEASDTTDLPAPEISGFDSSNYREIGVEIDLQDNNPDGDITVYRDGNALATVDRDTDEYTDDEDILDGEAYEYHLERDTGDATATGPSETTIASLPDAEGLSLDGTPPSELIVAWDDVLNNGQYRLEYRDDDPDGVEGSGVWGDGLYGEGLYSPYPDYQLETTIPHDGTLEHTIADVLDGEQFSVRIRTETEHATGMWLSAEEITKLYSPNTPTFTSVSETEVGLEWTNNSLFDGSNQVYRRRVYGNDSVGQWRLVGSVSDDETSYTDTGPRPDTEYEYRVTAVSQWVSSDGGSDTTTTPDIGLSHRAVPPTGWYAEIGADGTPFTPAILSDDTQYQPTLNGQPTATINVPRDEAYLLEQFEGAAMWVWKDGERREIDELEDVVIETDRDELVGYGATELEQDISVDVDEQPAHELAEELIGEHTDMVPTVDAPEDTIVEGVPIAAAIGGEDLEELFGPAVEPTDPVIFTGQYMLLAESCFFLEGEDYDVESMPSGSISIEEGEDYSGGESVFFDAPETAYLEWTFETEYTMPADAVTVAARRAGPFANFPLLGYRIDGEEVGVEGYDGGDPAWNEDVASGLDEDLEPGEHTLQAYIDLEGDGDPYELDCLAVYDNRYNYNFDEDVETRADGNHTIEGPEPLPDEHAIESDEILAATAVDTARVQTSIEGPPDVVEEPAALQVRFGLDDWLPDDGSEENTNSIEVTNPGDLSARLHARVTLRRYGQTSTSPTQGSYTQWLESIEIGGDLDTTPLVINQSPSGDLGDVLEQVADNANAVYEVWRDGEDTRFEWTYPGVRPATRADSISDYSVTKHNRRVLKCTVKGSNAPVRGETFTAGIGETVALEETDIVRGKETVRDADGDRLRSGFEYELDAIGGEITMLDSNRVDGGGEFEIDYDYTVSGTWEHDDYSGDLREARTEEIPAARSARAAEQAAQLIVDEHATPRWEADVSIAYEDVQDIRLTDTLDLEDVPGEAEVVYEIDDEGSESGLSLRLGNRKRVSETVSQIQSTLSSASELV